MRYTLHHGDNREVLRTMPDNSVDSIVTDPPYELGFMGKKWDSTGIAYDQTLWAECLRVLKPGGHLIAFGGTRTYHRMTCAIEDAGFEIRDCIQWIYGSGFPKSHNLDGDWHGFGTALKPANEPAVLARKPLSGTVADNVMTWGVGALNIDGCRVGSSGGTQWVSDGAQGDEGQFGGGIKDGKIASINAGRWPANVIFDEEAAQMLDAQSGHSVSKPHIQYKKAMKSIAKGYESARIDKVDYSDSGGASRFFYVAKASRAEREAGLDGMEVRQMDESRQEGNPGGDNPRNRGVHKRANHHPTVKPITLMRYLVRLVTPPGGVVLDPFMGSGSTGCAAMLEAMQFIGIELSAEYLEIARRRIEFHEYTVREKNPLGL
jgi:site-specific DNA-methyltransferase (adenine-specific)